MVDILCRKCGEPWESYYVHQGKEGFDGDEGNNAKMRFMSGQGCPACEWGTSCHHCGNSGKHTEWHGFNVIRRTDEPCRWCNGNPSNPQLPDDMLDEALNSLMDGTDEDVTMYLG